MNNDRGVALIFCYMVIAVLTALGSAFIAGVVSENGITARYVDSTRAFWVAEAGMAQIYSSWSQTGSIGSGGSVSGGSYTVTQDGPRITVTGTYNNCFNTLEADFIRVPLPFDNSISTGGNLLLRGLAARCEVYGDTRITGQYYKEGLAATGWFEDKQTGVESDQTTIKIPDFNSNGTADEFSDFVLFGQEAIASYPSDETVYIQTNGTVNIFPNQGLIGKKVIFVEGDSPGSGNVNILFDANWQEGEDLTVISTGTVTYLQPLQAHADARLSTISWSDYNEASIFRSEHQSVVYTHDDAQFVDILEWGSTTGNVIANDTVKDFAASGDSHKDGVSLVELLTYEKFYFSDRAKNGDMPPAFELLSGTSGTPYLKNWRQVEN